MSRPAPALELDGFIAALVQAAVSTASRADAVLTHALYFPKCANPDTCPGCVAVLQFAVELEQEIMRRESKP